MSARRLHAFSSTLGATVAFLMVSGCAFWAINLAGHAVADATPLPTGVGITDGLPTGAASSSGSTVRPGSGAGSATGHSPGQTVPPSTDPSAGIGSWPVPTGGTWTGSVLSATGQLVRRMATETTRGGRVRAGCLGWRISLTDGYAQPAPGWSVTVLWKGPEELKVLFAPGPGDGRDNVYLWGDCRQGNPVFGESTRDHPQQPRYVQPLGTPTPSASPVPSGAPTAGRTSSSGMPTP